MKKFLPICVSLFIVLLFFVKRIVILKLYPPICNFFIFSVFFLSLFTKETIIQKFAKICEGKLEEPTLRYTRNITYVWCIFTFINFLISVWTIFQSDKIWITYNGLISYILISLVFGVEYIVRITLRKRNLI